MRASAAAKEIARSLFGGLLIVTCLEGTLRTGYFVRNSMVDYIVLPYNAAQDFGPLPPWMDGLRILEEDEALVWRNRRNVHRRYLDVYSPVDLEEDRTALLRQFWPKVPVALRENPAWGVSLNSRGFRGEEFSTKKTKGAFRIACLGDSWTFGANVDQDAAYPQRLGALLEQRFPTANFEVLNLGVLSYSSHQGLEQLKRAVLDLEPDLLLVGFGMNDSSVAGYRDKDMRLDAEPDRAPQRVRKALQKLELVKLLRYVGQVAAHEPWSIGDYMEKIAVASGTSSEAWIGGQATESVDYTAVEPYTRVSPWDYQKNLLEMVDLARRHGASVVLLNNQLWDTPYRKVLEAISVTTETPLVDSKALIDAGRAAIEQSLEERLDLKPSGAEPAADGGEVEVVFRIYQGEHTVPQAIYIAGMHPKLGDGVPNRVAMHDDGTHGDQEGQDRVWSYAATFEPGTRLFYVYTNSGEEGRWQGMDIPEVRRFTVESGLEGARLYRPIESFGTMYMQADGWHTNAAGYEMIAKAVLDALLREESVQQHLSRVTEIVQGP